MLSGAPPNEPQTSPSSRAAAEGPKTLDRQQTSVIVENEVIEQIEDEPHGRSLAWVCSLIRTLGRDDPLIVLSGMWRGGKVLFADDSGNPVPSWRCHDVLRTGDEAAAFRVLATDVGSRSVHG